MMKSFSYYDMVDNFPKPGCAVCRLLQNDLERYLSSLLYEYVTTRQAHDAFRTRRGLCNQHSWRLMTRKEGGMNLAILYEAAVDEVLNALGEGSPAVRLGRLFGQQNGMAEKLLPEQPCVCCTHLTAAEKRYMDVVQQGLGQADFVSAYQQSDGFCLPHLTQVLQTLNSGAQIEIVMDKQRQVMTKLREDLRLYQLRYGLRAGGVEEVQEAMGDEATSWRRAIALLAGGDGLYGDDRSNEL